MKTTVSQIQKAARCLPVWLFLTCLFSQAFAAVDVLPQEKQLFDLLRTTAGQNRPHATLDSTLCRVARARAKDMATRHFFAHVNPDGVGPNLAVRLAGYKLPKWWGTNPTDNFIESIAAGHTTAGACWTAFLGSDHHADHLLARNAFYVNQTKVGIGYAFNNDDTYKHYWVVITAPPEPKPKLKITSPAKGAALGSNEVDVVGIASSKPEPVLVEGRVENYTGTSAFQTAEGVGDWRLRVNNLVPGRNKIRVRTVADDGSVIAEDSTVVDYVVLSPLTVVIDGEGTVSNELAGTTSQELGQMVNTVAKPAKGWIFAGWSGSVTSNNAALSFRMEVGIVLTARFVPDPFEDQGGNYVGVFSGSGQAGMVQMRLNEHGIYTGKLRLDGAKTPFSGKFSADADAEITVNGATLRMELNGDRTVDIEVTDGINTMTSTADRTVHTAKATKTKLVIGEAVGVDAPAGEGSATLSVRKSGRVHFVGVLADGTAFSQGLRLTKNGTVPVYVSLDEKAAHLAGDLAASAPAGGALLWEQAGAFSATAQVSEAP